MGYSKDPDVKSSVEYQISPYTTSFGNNVKLIEFHCLDNYLDLKNYDIDVNGIYSELENNEENYTENDIHEIKSATVKLANLFVRRKNSMNFEMHDVLYNFDFSKNEMESTEKHM